MPAAYPLNLVMWYALIIYPLLMQPASGGFREVNVNHRNEQFNLLHTIMPISDQSAAAIDFFNPFINYDIKFDKQVVALTKPCRLFALSL